MKRGKNREKSTKPLRNCNTQRLLFIEAGLEQKKDRHLLCTWNTTVLPETQTNILKDMHIDGLLEPSQDHSCLFFHYFLSSFFTTHTIENTWSRIHPKPRTIPFKRVMEPATDGARER